MKDELNLMKHIFEDTFKHFDKAESALNNVKISPTEVIAQIKFSPKALRKKQVTNKSTASKNEVRSGFDSKTKGLIM